MDGRYEKILRELREADPPFTVLEEEPMDRHCTFRAGGRADLMVCVESISQLSLLARLLREEDLPFVVAGRGSNLLVSDRGYHGAILQLSGSPFQEITVRGETMTCGAAVTLHQAAQAACEAGLSGMEALSGIPGTVGGALAMNAGAYGTEMKDVVVRVTAFDPEKGADLSGEEGKELPDNTKNFADSVDGQQETIVLTTEDMRFGYRTSAAKTRPLIFLTAEFQLRKEAPDIIREKTRALQEQRAAKQPLEYPSAGSTFKRPEGHFAGQLIEEAGLRGFRIGDAQVSKKHCGFVINRGNATATEILTLMREVREKVREHSGVVLEPEVMILGETF